MYFENYSKNFQKIIEKLDFKKIEMIKKIIQSKKKNKIHVFGNGAGASIASHFANDLTNSAKFKVYSYDNSAQITCLANDYNYSNWVKKIIDYYVEKNDLIIFLSASGESQNMIQAAKLCLKKKYKFISITGFNEKNRLNSLSNYFCWVDSKSYNHVELAQLFILLSIVDSLNKKK
ncbi:SIS domain-containing protein [Candidatus Pelagibacter sp.]|nr:SIS domain-containing protein [Candidatus Pelagibacter sp.]